MALRLTRLVDPVTRGWTVVAAGSAARLVLGFVASVLIARSLGPETFAVFAVLAATAGVAGTIADLGLSDAGVRRVAEAWSRNPPEAAPRANGFFWLRAGAAGLVALGGCLLALPLSVHVLGLSNPLLLGLALAGVLATALSGGVTSLLQATGRFREVAAVMLANSGLTALLALLLAGAGRLDIWTALMVLGIGTSLVAFGFGAWLLPRPLKLGAPVFSRLRSEARILVPFGLWLWIGGVFAILAAQLDLFMVNRFLDPATVGFYALAVNLASKAEVANHSLYTVLLTSASSLKGDDAVRSYLRGGLLRSSFLAVALLPLFPLAAPLIGFFYGSAFLPTAPIFQLLLAVALFELFTTPFLLLAFTFDRPRVVAVAEATRAATLGGVGLVLIPLLGPPGAAAARLISRIVGLVAVVRMLAR